MGRYKLKKIGKKILTITLVVILMYSLVVGIVSAVIPTINVDPESPTPQSTVKFTSEIDDQNVQEVRLLFQECNANTGICHERKNLSMSEISEGTYETSVAMEFGDTTYIQYSLNVKTSGGWMEYLEGTKKNLNTQQNDGNGTPGFEFIIFISAAIFIISLIYKRRR